MLDAAESKTSFYTRNSKTRSNYPVTGCVRFNCVHIESMTSESFKACIECFKDSNFEEANK